MSTVWKTRLLDAEDAAVLRGYDNAHRCLFCDASADSAVAAHAHIAAVHGTPLAALLALDKQLTGLTDTQKALIALWQGGTSDAQIAAERGVSTSTLRNQRFALREREREARLLLAILSLSGLSSRTLRSPVAPVTTEDGVSQFYKNGVLTSLPARDAKRHAVMLRFAAMFEPNRRYCDREVRDLISPVFADHATIRRYLVDYGLMKRTPDNKEYWREASCIHNTSQEEESMSFDKKAAKLAYKSTITPMGIYCIRDTQSGRCVIAADRNLGSVMGRLRFLMNGTSAQPAGPLSDPQLYADFKDHADAFVFEVLEQVDVAKCATYEEASEKLNELKKESLPRYADRPQYIQK